MTPKERAAMQQALEALDVLLTEPMAKIAADKAEALLLRAAPALREALAEQTEQEQVAKVIRNEAGQISMQKPDGNYFDISKHVGEYFYTAPVRTKDLTDDEISDVFDSVGSWKETLFGDLPVVFARAVIAKFKEKNK